MWNGPWILITKTHEKSRSDWEEYGVTEQKELLSDKKKSEDPGTISQLRQLMFTQRKTNKFTAEHAVNSTFSAHGMLCVSIPGPVSVACFSHVPLLVSIKCNKWKYLQTAATDWNELNVLECPCHKRASTSWARSDRWVFFLMLILLNATCQHSPCLWDDWANVTECHRLLSHPFGQQWCWKLHGTQGCKTGLSLWSYLEFRNSIFIYFTEWTKRQRQN